MITLKAKGGIKIKFDPEEDLDWDIFDAQSNKKIGRIEIDDEQMVVGADISQEYQRKGIATAVIKYLVEECGCEFYFWPPDGLTYNDARHLSVEGANLANSLVEKGLAKWIKVGPCAEDETF
ncbi:hypothetical protein C41B8_00155 [Salinisphaera hydrothermalis C41B8]|uniref:N-acetyltransferase domain-containing protein n=2 Tax=Salinisphaera TaxID=180541 RepID=A0A084IQY0_SALHC|nr:hypothetical protein C41B8_00155 [Salinisphaera hydrothermalis C41B8]